MSDIALWLEERLVDPCFHARWLNTLSYLENCGARLIARCEHPTLVPSEVLKHAAEEFRHAYHFKSLARKFAPGGLADYQPANILGGWLSYHYMSRLNTAISRWLKREGFVGQLFKEAAYLLVTYAVEVRAMAIYRPYQAVLVRRGYPISIHGVLREEEHHLAEMEEGIALLDDAERLRQEAIRIEEPLYAAWWSATRTAR